MDLYSAIVEETLNFNANNGENVHHDVFRKSNVGITPLRIELPEIVGEDTVITFTTEIDSEWNGNELKAINILQDDQKQVEQANESDLLAFTASLKEETLLAITLYPNPSNGKVFIKSNNKTIERVAVYAVTGQVIINDVFESSEATIDLTNENKGVYICKVFTAEGVFTKRLVKN